MKRTILFTLASMLFFASCGSSEQKQETSDTQPSAAPKDKQYNITILLDLSNRLIRSVQPSQKERDIEAVKQILGVMRSHLSGKGTYKSKDKIRVIFSPAPADPNINSLAKKLSVDFSKLDNGSKRDAYKSMEDNFATSLSEIYDLTLQSQKWVGSDIWRFFKYDVRELCIDRNPDYENILVVITDGYLYHVQSKDRVNNRTAYIPDWFLKKEGLSNNPKWEQKFKEQDYGLISINQKLDNLSILMLEVNPVDSQKNDEDIIRAYIAKWFDEMQVSRYSIYNTDLPQNTANRIENFFR
ncbi:hypothetical protein [Rhodoflexus caldus]|uniref:hypothetical protein n=1 Tax=Rhodoflexus caldus TaxID=2891236 RepID=UPI00202A5170|nr:hypothetical protein [Rhodoflexus caldus]